MTHLETLEEIERILVKAKIKIDTKALLMALVEQYGERLCQGMLEDYGL